MFGIEGKDLEPIQIVAKQFDPYPVYNPEKLGEWGILFLCCGAMAGGNKLWRDKAINSDTYIRPSDLNKILQGVDVCTSDDYAEKFSKLIVEWSNDSVAMTVIEKRLEDLIGKMSDKAFLCHKKYVTLAFMLNSAQGMAREKLLGFDCPTWVSISNGRYRNYGWPELFFTAGLLLCNSNDVDWNKMASVIHGRGKSLNIDVSALYGHYVGENSISKTESTKIRTDRIKKGMRVRLRNGWEAIVLKKCDGNTLKAEVFGDFTETGSIYAHDVVAAMVNGKWVDVEMTEEQSQFYKQVKQLFR